MLVAPGLVLSEADAAIPDVVWVSQARLARVVDGAGHLRAAPELVVEVLSPGAANERRDRDAKLRLYSTYGVHEYWIVDWRAQTLELYRREKGQLRLVATLGRDDTPTSPEPPGFSVVVGRLFDPE